MSAAEWFKKAKELFKKKKDIRGKRSERGNVGAGGKALAEANKALDEEDARFQVAQGD